MALAAQLSSEHEELLCMVVEASRRVGRDARQKFYAIDSFEGTGLQHPGLGNDAVPVYRGDVEALGRLGLLFVSERQRGVLSFDVSPQGFEVYGELKRRKGQAVERIESEIRQLLGTSAFATKYPIAQRKWSEAESLLWQSTSEHQLTTVGHLAREAMQEFAEVLVRQVGITEAGAKADIIKRIRAVLNQGVSLGKTEKPFMDALIAYWGTVSDLVQRQEHGAQREGEPLDWDDARRVVLQTAITMFEIDTVLTRGGK